MESYIEASKRDKEDWKKEGDSRQLEDEVEDVADGFVGVETRAAGLQAKLNELDKAGCEATRSSQSFNDSIDDESLIRAAHEVMHSSQSFTDSIDDESLIQAEAGMF